VREDVRMTLYLLRHAKSSWDEPGLADHDRPLAPRGRRAAKLIPKHIRSEGIAPELVLCSTARRARETFEGIASALGDDPEVRFEDGLYGASADALLARLQAIPEDVESAMLIGHNPSIESLALLLAASGNDLDRLRSKFPTGALATLTFDVPWAELAPGTATLTAFVRPKDLK
jgi:phosphohistidine phosphatase